MVMDQIRNDNRASEQRYRHLFEILPNSVFLINQRVTPAPRPRRKPCVRGEPRWRNRL
jgi:hypothetical protein